MHVIGFGVKITRFSFVLFCAEHGSLSMEQEVGATDFRVVTKLITKKCRTGNLAWKFTVKMSAIW